MNSDDSWPLYAAPVMRPRRSARARWGLAVALLVAAACERRRSVPYAVPKVPVQSAPAVTAPADAGALVTLSIDDVRKQVAQAAGHVLVVHIWATWCRPCLYELPEFDLIAAGASRRGAQVLTLAVDTEYNQIARVATVLRENAPHLAPVVADYGGKTEFFRLFSQNWNGSIPATFIFDRNGKLAAEFLMVGEFQGMNTALNKLLPPS